MNPEFTGKGFRSQVLRRGGNIVRYLCFGVHGAQCQRLRSQIKCGGRTWWSARPGGWDKTKVLASEGEAFGEAFGQAGGENFLLGGGDVVLQAAQLDGLGVHVIEDVGALGVVVAGLADGTDVDKIFLGGIDLEFGVGAAADDGVAHEGDGHMGVAEEAHLRVLIGEISGGGEFVKDVLPAFGGIEGGVDHGEVGRHAGVFQVAEPLLVFGGKLVAGPVDGFGGVGVEAVEGVFGGAVFVVVALDAGDIHLPDDVEAFLGLGVVAHDVAEADDVGGILGANVLQDDLERIQVAVNVCDNGVFHGLTSDFKTPELMFCIRPLYVLIAN